MSNTELAKFAYNVYAENAGGKNFRGDPMPEWDALPVNIKQNWFAVVTELLVKISTNKEI